MVAPPPAALLSHAVAPPGPLLARPHAEAHAEGASSPGKLSDVEMQLADNARRRRCANLHGAGGDAPSVVAPTTARLVAPGGRALPLAKRSASHRCEPALRKEDLPSPTSEGRFGGFGFGASS